MTMATTLGPASSRFDSPCWRPFWLLLALAAAGCGSGHPDTYPVHGRVTIGGQPVTSGKIMFYPDEGRAAMADLQSDGTYRLTTFDPGDGALPGKHRVTVQAIQATGAVPQADSVEGELAMAQSGKSSLTANVKMQWLVPRKYSNRATSPLETNVGREENERNFDLPAQ